ncbi:MAG: hypothetical protein GF408_01595 [Candidatus Omnitrophica bacterium]|nr:hypothetical protein [Candidatus Omnitrophota bacterium]
MGPDLKLIETILWEDGNFFLLDLHLARLSGSAGYFDFQLEKEALADALSQESSGFFPGKKYKTRLLLESSGSFSISSGELDETPDTPVKITLSDKYTDRSDTFLYHKTTNRELYDRELKRHREKGFFDVIFMNRQAEITEGAMTNLIALSDGEYLTPPVACGVLPGVYREHLLAGSEMDIKEKVLYIEDLQNAKRLFICNSVRKLLPAELCL